MEKLFRHNISRIRIMLMEFLLPKNIQAFRGISTYTLVHCVSCDINSGIDLVGYVHTQIFGEQKKRFNRSL